MSTIYFYETRIMDMDFIIASYKSKIILCDKKDAAIKKLNKIKKHLKYQNKIDINTIKIEKPDEEKTDKIIKNTIDQIHDFLQKKIKSFSIEIETYGTELQKIIWKNLNEINYGKTISYSDYTTNILKLPEKTTRFVAKTISQNPLPIILPCHRVIGKNGKLTGYSLGIDLKKKLLEIEGSLSSQ